MSKLVRGFTLIELLVVIAIIGLLASMILVSLSVARAKARDASRITAFKEMVKLIELIDVDPGVSFAGLNQPGANPGNCATAGVYVDVRNCVTPNLNNYKDPSTSGTNCTKNSSVTCQYVVNNQNGTAGVSPKSNDYEICAYLENGFNGSGAGMYSTRSNTNGNIVSGCN